LKYPFFGRPYAPVRIQGYAPAVIFRSKPAQLIYDIWNRRKTNA
jgi:hypothetical protein